MTKHHITLYTADWCGYCHSAKQYLEQKNVAFVEKDIEYDAGNAAEAIAKSGQKGVPVIDIDGIIVTGFDQEAIDAALKAKKIIA